MRTDSLAFRLFAAAAAWALVVLPLTAFVLLSVHRGAVERSFDARLNVYLTALVARTESPSRDFAANPPSIRDPRFSLPFSGWYWQIKPLGDSTYPFLASESLLDQTLVLPGGRVTAPGAPYALQAYVPGPENQRLRILEREIVLGGDGNDAARFSVAVAANAQEIEQAVDEFRTLLVAALTILGLGLVLATFFQVRFGLRPLRAIGQGLTAIRAGNAKSLEGDLPIEIEPLQKELNALIQSNQAIVERARTHVGNLAHALKTPLSVITNEAEGQRTGLARKVGEQAAVMRDQIDHHLKRASMAARSGVVSGQTRVEPVLKALVRTLGRIHQERGLTMRLDCPEEAVFRGERQDLEEMTGNLLDNACKWAKSEVSLTVARQGDKISLCVDDDGPGLPKKARAAAMKRGRRLDESKPGSGLGLSIVTELAHVYEGRLFLQESEKGGLCAHLELPGS